MIVYSFVVDEIVEELKNRLRLVFGHHVSSSFDSYYSHITIVNLIKACMLVSDVPRAPLSCFIEVKFLYILLSISVRNYIINISTIEPYFDLFVQ